MKWCVLYWKSSGAPAFHSHCMSIDTETMNVGYFINCYCLPKLIGASLTCHCFSRSMWVMHVVLVLGGVKGYVIFFDFVTSSHHGSSEENLDSLTNMQANAEWWRREMKHGDCLFSSLCQMVHLAVLTQVISCLPLPPHIPLFSHPHLLVPLLPPPFLPPSLTFLLAKRVKRKSG